MSQFADRIREAAKNKSGPTSTVDAASGISSQLQSQQTGKTVTAAPTGQSDIASRMNVAVAEAQGEEVEQQTQATAEKLGLAEQTEDLKQKSITQDREQKKQAVDDYALKTMLDIGQKIKHSDLEFEDREDAFELEQAASALRLGDRKYTDNLDMVGKENRLDDKINWDQMMAEVMIGESMSSTLQELDFLTKEGALDRAFKEKTMNMNMDQAWKVAEAAADDAMQGAMIGAAASAAKTGIDYNASQPTTESPSGLDSETGIPWRPED